MMVDILFQLKLNTFKKAMILIALLYIAYKHPLIFCKLMLVIYAFYKSAADPKYCLLLVDLFTSKVYVYGMKNRSFIPLKLEKFYKEVASKRKNKKMCSTPSTALTRARLGIVMAIPSPHSG